MNDFNSASFTQCIGGLILLTLASTASSGECARTDIDYYLERGFSHDQITKICSTEKNPTTEVTDTRQPTAPVQEVTHPPQKAAAVASDVQDTQDTVYLQTVIDAETVDITEDYISYTIDRCLDYGEERFSLTESSCVIMQTRIARNGLKVINTVNPIILLRDAQLLINARIHREIVFKHPIKPSEKTAFLKDYPLRLEELNIPLKRGIMPDEVAKVLKRMAK